MLTARDSVHCVRLKLIDTDSGRLVTFREARAIVRSAATANTAAAAG